MVFILTRGHISSCVNFLSIYLKDWFKSNSTSLSYESSKTVHWLHYLRLLDKQCNSLHINQHVIFDFTLCDMPCYYNGIMFQVALQCGSVGSSLACCFASRSDLLNMQILANSAPGAYIYNRQLFQSIENSLDVHQGLGQWGTVARGGRYDSLLAHTSHPKSFKYPISAVGVVISIDKVLNHLAINSRTPTILSKLFTTQGTVDLFQYLNCFPIYYPYIPLPPKPMDKTSDINYIHDWGRGSAIATTGLSLLLPSGERNFNSNSFQYKSNIVPALRVGSVDVFVCHTNNLSSQNSSYHSQKLKSSLLNFKLDLVSQLWAVDISCEHVHPENLDFYALLRCAKAIGAHYAVVLKPKDFFSNLIDKKTFLSNNPQNNSLEPRKPILINPNPYVWIWQLLPQPSAEKFRFSDVAQQLLNRLERKQSNLLHQIEFEAAKSRAPYERQMHFLAQSPSIDIYRRRPFIDLSKELSSMKNIQDMTQTTTQMTENVAHPPSSSKSFQKNVDSQLDFINKISSPRRRSLALTRLVEKYFAFEMIIPGPFASTPNRCHSCGVRSAAHFVVEYRLSVNHLLVQGTTPFLLIGMDLPIIAIRSLSKMFYIFKKNIRWDQPDIWPSKLIDFFNRFQKKRKNLVKIPKQISKLLKRYDSCQFVFLYSLKDQDVALCRMMCI